MRLLLAVIALLAFASLFAPTVSACHPIPTWCPELSCEVPDMECGTLPWGVVPFLTECVPSYAGELAGYALTPTLIMAGWTTETAIEVLFGC